MKEKIDIILTTYNRKELTIDTLDFIFLNSNHPYRLIVVDNNSTDGLKDILEKKYNKNRIDKLIFNKENLGLERALNIGFKEVQSSYFITIDNDILVPQDWIKSLKKLMNAHPDFAAISLRPQIMIGVGQIFKTDQEVVENNVAGGSGRMMLRKAVKEAGGWSDQFQNEGRGNEEWNISGKLKELGYKVGYAKDVFCYHQWGDNHWGYKNVDYRMGRRLEEAPFDVEFDPITMKPKHKNNE